jgi:hypothetical protein
MKGQTMEQLKVKEQELTIQQMAQATGLSASRCFREICVILSLICILAASGCDRMKSRDRSSSDTWSEEPARVIVMGT